MELKEIIVKIYENPVFQGVLASVGGGVTRVVVDWKGQFKLKSMLASIITAAYVGVFVVFFADYYEVNKKLVLLASLACGLAHVEIVTLIRKKILKKINESDKYE